MLAKRQARWQACWHAYMMGAWDLRVHSRTHISTDTLMGTRYLRTHLIAATRAHTHVISFIAIALDRVCSHTHTHTHTCVSHNREHARARTRTNAYMRRHGAGSTHTSTHVHRSTHVHTHTDQAHHKIGRPLRAIPPPLPTTPAARLHDTTPPCPLPLPFRYPPSCALPRMLPRGAEQLLRPRAGHATVYHASNHQETLRRERVLRLPPRHARARARAGATSRRGCARDTLAGRFLRLPLSPPGASAQGCGGCVLDVPTRAGVCVCAFEAGQAGAARLTLAPHEHMHAPTRHSGHDLAHPLALVLTCGQYATSISLAAQIHTGNPMASCPGPSSSVAAAPGTPSCSSVALPQTSCQSEPLSSVYATTHAERLEGCVWVCKCVDAREIVHAVSVMQVSPQKAFLIKKVGGHQGAAESIRHAGGKTRHAPACRDCWPESSRSADAESRPPVMLRALISAPQHARVKRGMRVTKAEAGHRQAPTTTELSASEKGFHVT